MALPDWALEPLKARLSTTHFVPVVTQCITLDPERAAAAGFLHRLVPEGQAVETALAIASELAKLPSADYAGNKLVSRKQALDIMSASLAA